MFFNPIQFVLERILHKKMFVQEEEFVLILINVCVMLNTQEIIVNFQNVMELMGQVQLFVQEEEFVVIQTIAHALVQLDLNVKISFVLDLITEILQHVLHLEPVLMSINVIALSDF
jgi:hypothetical protein